MSLPKKSGGHFRFKTTKCAKAQRHKRVEGALRTTVVLVLLESKNGNK